MRKRKLTVAIWEKGKNIFKKFPTLVEWLACAHRVVQHSRSLLLVSFDLQADGQAQSASNWELFQAGSHTILAHLTLQCEEEKLSTELSSLDSPEFSNPPQEIRKAPIRPSDVGVGSERHLRVLFHVWMRANYALPRLATLAGRGMQVQSTLETHSIQAVHRSLKTITGMLWLEYSNRVHWATTRW